MEILQLKYFFESAQTENFTKTAEKFMVPTASVSASVKRLENELGCKLFDRHSNRISLNDKGKALMHTLGNVFSELNLITEKLSSLDTDFRKINILVRAIRSDITECIISFRIKHPNIDFSTDLDFNEKNFEKYDIIIDEKNNNYSGYESFELYKVKLMLAANCDNPLCNRVITVSDLKSEPFISWGENSNMHKMLMNTCNKAGFLPNICVTTNDMSCYERLIESGVGIGFTREDSAMLKKGRVKPIKASDFKETYTVCCYYKKHNAYGNVKAFLDFLKSTTNEKI